MNTNVIDFELTLRTSVVVMKIQVQTLLLL